MNKMCRLNNLISNSPALYASCADILSPLTTISKALDLPTALLSLWVPLAP